MSDPGTPDLPDDECPLCDGPLASDGVCADDYPEHDTRDTCRGDDGVQWECRRCGAEGWEPAAETE